MKLLSQTHNPPLKSTNCRRIKNVNINLINKMLYKEIGICVLVLIREGFLKQEIKPRNHKGNNVLNYIIDKSFSTKKYSQKMPDIRI